MRYTPTTAECAAVATMTDAERLDYFVTRAYETEEVWGLGSSQGWRMNDRDGDTLLPVWPFAQLVAGAGADDDASHAPNAISLEHFVERILPLLIDQGIKVEVLPHRDGGGCLLEAKRLLQVFEGVMDAGEYRLEG